MWNLAIWTLISIHPTAYNIEIVQSFMSQKACQTAADKYNYALNRGDAKCEPEEEE